MKKILLLYSYYESTLTKINLEFFNNFGMYRTDDVSYNLIINGQTCSANLSDRWDSITKRENLGFDFSAWYEKLNTINLLKYNYFIFINDTVRGPFNEKRWIKKFLNLLNDQTKLSGISINCYIGPFVFPIPSPHVQSMLLCTDKKGLEIIYPSIINEYRLDKLQTIFQKEITLSKTILASGYNISCMLPGFNVDFRKLENCYINSNNGFSGDPWYPNAFFGNTIIPSDGIFFKTNRGLNEGLLQKMTDSQYKNKWY